MEPSRAIVLDFKLSCRSVALAKFIVSQVYRITVSSHITVQFRSIRQSRVTGPPDGTKFRICYGSLSYLTKVLHVTHAEIMVNIVIFPLIGSESDEISPLSRPSSQGDEIKISSGASRCHMGDESIEIVQYHPM
jgi:hypothetical protein